MTALFVLTHFILLSYTALPVVPTHLPKGIDFIHVLVSRIDSDTILVDEVDNCDRRTTRNIIWSCLTTIFACTWVAIHPNIPGLHDTKWKILRRRLKLMLRVIFLPETVVYWAWRQHYGAQEVARRYNDGNLHKRRNIIAMSTILPLVGINMNEEPRWEEPWTRTHGFFAIMGGFMLCHGDDKPIKTLTPDELFEHAAAGAIDWPKISEDEIWDRSKGDYLSKGFVVLQTSWFIATCMARIAERLPITELEIVTLAFAALNGLIYFFWFNKPLDVRCPIRVHLKSSYHGPLLEMFDDASISEVYIPRIDHRLSAKMRLRNILGAIVAAAARVWTAITSPFSDHGLIMSLLLLVKAAEGDSPDDESYGREETRVKTFFAPISLQRTRDIYFAFLVVLGLVFGGIHLAGWSIEFPSEDEKWVWRVSSLTLLGSPIVFLASALILIWIVRGVSPGPCRMVFVSFLSLVFCMSIVGYLFSRIVLLILPFIAFRSLPPGTLTDVKWTYLVPHIS